MEFKREIAGQSSTQTCLLVYDGECRLCVSAKLKLEELTIGRASEVRFLKYQSDAAKRMLGPKYCPGRPNAAFLIRPSGEVVQGLDAFLPLIPILPGGKLLLWWLRFPPSRRLTEWGYRMVARHRYRWFGKADPLS